MVVATVIMAVDQKRGPLCGALPSEVTTQCQMSICPF